MHIHVIITIVKISSLMVAAQSKHISMIKKPIGKYLIDEISHTYNFHIQIFYKSCVCKHYYVL